MPEQDRGEHQKIVQLAAMWTGALLLLAPVASRIGYWVADVIEARAEQHYYQGSYCLRFSFATVSSEPLMVCDGRWWTYLRCEPGCCMDLSECAVSILGPGCAFPDGSLCHEQLASGKHVFVVQVMTEGPDDARSIQVYETENADCAPAVQSITVGARAPRGRGAL